MRYPFYLLRRVPSLLLAVGMLISTSFSSGVQLQNPSTLPGAHPPISGTTTDENVWAQRQQKEMQKQANIQRQEEIKKETEKLLELATELKQSVDKSNENTLSLDVIKKAEQIEKLAKSVKDKMKGP
jgi:hypothetical protein